MEKLRPAIDLCRGDKLQTVVLIWYESRDEDNGEKSLPASASIISTWRPSTHRSSPLSRTSSRPPPSASAPSANCSRGRSSRRCRAPTRGLSSLPFPTRSRNMNVCPRRLTPGPGPRWSTLAVCNSGRFTSAGRRSCLHRPTTCISSPQSAWPFRPRREARDR